jgi:hypothetical protein
MQTKVVAYKAGGTRRPLHVNDSTMQYNFIIGIILFVLAQITKCLVLSHLKYSMIYVVGYTMVQ